MEPSARREANSRRRSRLRDLPRKSVLLNWDFLVSQILDAKRIAESLETALQSVQKVISPVKSPRATAEQCQEFEKIIVTTSEAVVSISFIIIHWT